MTITHGGVNAGGKTECGTVSLQADGKEHAVSMDAPGVATVTTRQGNRRLQTVATRDGVAIGEQTYEVSADGRTLTASVWGTDVSGRRFEQVIVFDRK